MTTEKVVSSRPKLRTFFPCFFGLKMECPGSVLLLLLGIPPRYFFWGFCSASSSAQSGSGRAGQWSEGILNEVWDPWEVGPRESQGKEGFHDLHGNFCIHKLGCNYGWYFLSWRHIPMNMLKSCAMMMFWMIKSVAYSHEISAIYKNLGSVWRW